MVGMKRTTRVLLNIRSITVGEFKGINVNFIDRRMKTLKFKRSASTIKKANRNLMISGVNFDVRNNYSGIITTRTLLNGVVIFREISKEKINEAYGKSLKEYAEKL
jgi:hypothetical protein